MSDDDLSSTRIERLGLLAALAMLLVAQVAHLLLALALSKRPGMPTLAQRSLRVSRLRARVSARVGMSFAEVAPPRQQAVLRRVVRCARAAAAVVEVEVPGGLDKSALRPKSIVATVDRQASKEYTMKQQ